MMSLDEDALLCDLAETYHIYSFDALPITTIATLACGLRDNSRIKCKLAGVRAPLDTVLLSMIADRLSLILWSKTKDGQKNKNRPDPITPKLYLTETEEERVKVKGYNSPQDFMAAREKLLHHKAGEVK